MPGAPGGGGWQGGEPRTESACHAAPQAKPKPFLCVMWLEEVGVRVAFMTALGAPVAVLKPMPMPQAQADEKGKRQQERNPLAVTPVITLVFSAWRTAGFAPHRVCVTCLGRTIQSRRCAFDVSWDVACGMRTTMRTTVVSIRRVPPRSC